MVRHRIWKLKSAQLEEKGINDRWRKTVGPADDVVRTTEDVKDMEHQLNTVNEESLKIGLKIHKGKTKFMTNIDTTDNIQIDETETEKVTTYRYLGQTIALENRKKQEVSIRIKAGWSGFGKYREILMDRHLPMSLKRKIWQAPSHEFKKVWRAPSHEFKKVWQAPSHEFKQVWQAPSHEFKQVWQAPSHEFKKEGLTGTFPWV